MSNRIRPNRALIGPLSTAPNVKPRHMIELIQEPSSAVIGPVRRWLFSLISTGRLGEHQPKAMPYDNTARFTIQILKKKKRKIPWKNVSADVTMTLLPVANRHYFLKYESVLTACCGQILIQNMPHFRIYFLQLKITNGEPWRRLPLGITVDRELCVDQWSEFR